jgi:hypothetical protein
MLLFVDRLCYGHAPHGYTDDFLGFPIRQVLLPLVHTAALITKVDQLDQVGIQTRLARRPLEDRIVCSVTARRNHHPVEIVFQDLTLDLVNALSKTGRF